MHSAKTNFAKITNVLRHGKRSFGMHTDSEGPDQTAHSHSLIRAIASRLQNNLPLDNITTYSKVPFQTFWPQYLVRVFSVVYYPHFLMVQLINIVKK